MTRIFSLIVVLAFGLGGFILASARTASGQTTVGLDTPEASISVTTDDAVALADVVIESSLRGVGRMLGELRGGVRTSTDAGQALPDDVAIHFDPEHQRYAVTSQEGGRVWIDAHSGRYTIEARGAAAFGGALIEESLAAVGSMIRGLRALQGAAGHASAPHTEAAPLGLTPIELARLDRIWRSSGASEAEVLLRRRQIEHADRGLRASIRALDASMERLDREMADLERQLGGGDP